TRQRWRATARRPRLRQGASGRALVSRSARDRGDGRSRARMIELEVPRKLRSLVTQAQLIATNVFRPISRKYDTAEHAYPKELDMVAALLDGIAQAGGGATVNDLERGATGKPRTVNQAA